MRRRSAQPRRSKRKKLGSTSCTASSHQATAIANDTLYGLSAGVWTRDHDRALRLARAIRAGTVWGNCFMDGFPELPFGGYRQSGLGRELGMAAVEEFTETKTVVLRTGPHPAHWWMPPAGDAPR